MMDEHRIRAPFKIVVRRFSRGAIAERWDLFSLKMSCIWPVRTGVFVRYYWHFETTVEEICRPGRWQLWSVLPK